MLALRQAFQSQVKNTVLKGILGTRDLDNVDQKKISQIMRNEEFELQCLDRVQQMLSNPQTVASAQSYAKVFISTAIAITPSEKSPKQPPKQPPKQLTDQELGQIYGLYTNLIYKPTYEHLKKELRIESLTQIQQNQVYNLGCSNGFQNMIREPVLRELLGTDNLDDVDKETIQEANRRPEYRQACERVISEIVRDGSAPVYLQAIIHWVIIQVAGPSDDVVPPDDLVPPADDDF